MQGMPSALLGSACPHHILVYLRTPAQGICVKVYDAISGKCISTISPSSTKEKLALEDVLSLRFNDELGEFYTGNEKGRAYVWTN